MNQHLNDGQLRAALDGELPAIGSAHLQDCALCQQRQNALRAQSRQVASRLAFLSAEPKQNMPATGTALRYFYERKLPQKEIPMFKRLFASSGVRFAAVALLLLVLVVSIPSTRALADQLLSLFRVQQVTVIPVDFTGMEQLSGNSALGKQVSELVSNSVTVTQKPGDPVTVTDTADASQKAGFTVRLPQSDTASRISVMNTTAFSFNIDRTRAQALLDEAGRSDLLLPDSIDGAVVKVNIPASVSAAYGECPQSAQDGQSPTKPSLPGRNYPDCLLMTELPSPTVSAPAGVDVALLAQIGLEFSGMSREQAAAFTQTVDWTSTLVIPIPKNAATYQQISVDGVTGTLIQRPADDSPQFVLIWIKNGIVYSIGGLGTDSQKALDMANSLP